MIQPISVPEFRRLTSLLEDAAVATDETVRASAAIAIYEALRGQQTADPHALSDRLQQVVQLNQQLHDEKTAAQQAAAESDRIAIEATSRATRAEAALAEARALLGRSNNILAIADKIIASAGQLGGLTKGLLDQANDLKRVTG